MMTGHKKEMTVFATLSVSTLIILIFLGSLWTNFTVYTSLCTEPPGDCLYDGQVNLNQADSLQRVGLSLFQYSLLKVVIDFIQASGCLVIGMILLWKAPRSTVSLLASVVLLARGLSFGIYNLEQLEPEFWFIFSLIDFLAGMYIVFFYIYPDGKFHSILTIVLSILWVVISIGRSWFPGSLLDPFAWPVLLETIGWIGFHLTAFYVLVVKFRASREKQQQQQIKWLIYGLFATLMVIIGIAVVELAGTPELPVVISNILVNFLMAIAALVLPVSLLIAILYYHLWNIDFLVKKTFVYSTLIAISVSFYMITVATLNALLQTQSNYFISLFAAGLLAVTFQPLQQKTEQSIQKVIYGDLDSPYNVFTRIGRQFDAAASNEQFVLTILETISDSLKLPYAAIKYQDERETEVVEQLGTKPVFLEEVPLIYRNQRIGTAVIGKHESFSRKEKKLLSDLAHHVSIAVYAHLMTRKVMSSRNKILAAREEERRMLRHELHDGIGPSLATIKLLAEAAPYSPRQEELLKQIQFQTQHTLNTVREIVEALRPTEIDQLGLCHALEKFIHQIELAGMKAEFIVPTVFPKLPAAVEAAIYRITQEAIHNVIKHSSSDYCRVKLEVTDYVVLQIEDNGIGFTSPVTKGIGLESMRERAAENGGFLEIRSVLEHGTSILVKFPYSELE